MDRPQFRYQSHKKNQPRKLWPVLLLLIFISTLTTYTYLAINKPLPKLNIKLNTINKPAEAVAVTWPSNGQAAYGSNSRGLLAASKPNAAPQPMASTAKILTALAVLSKKPLVGNEVGPVIILGEQDVEFYKYYLNNDGSNVPVVSGEQITERAALEALLLPSANNIADSLAFWAFGSMESYVTYANSLLKSYGLKNTTVADSSGFSSSTVSTAEDLVKLGEKAMQNQTIKSIVAQKNSRNSCGWQY